MASDKLSNKGKRLEKNQLPDLLGEWFWSWSRDSKSWRALSKDGLTHVGVNTRNRLSVSFHSGRDKPGQESTRWLRRVSLPVSVVVAVFRANGIAPDYTMESSEAHVDPVWDAAVRLLEAKRAYNETELDDDGEQELGILLSRVDELCAAVESASEKERPNGD